MNQEIVDQIQTKIIKLFPKDKQSSIGILYNDSCSEISRLVAGWIKEVDESSRLLILKGVNVCDSQKSHDILAVETSNNDVYVIDTTIWQFFPEKKSILLSISNNLDEALKKISELYGGKWQVSEEISQVSPADEKKYLDIISQNIKENQNENKFKKTTI